MDNSPDELRQTKKRLCRWCDARPAPPDGRPPVCERCHKLLSGAGLCDEEIYGAAPEGARSESG